VQNRQLRPFVFSSGVRMPNPVIGVTTSYGKNKHGHPTIYLLRAYVEALIETGGAPVLIPRT